MYQVVVFGDSRKAEKKMNEMAAQGWSLHTMSVVYGPSGYEYVLTFVR
ncbi:hypothetical protein ACFWU5_18895 [Nocardia sp. NPDC058640]